MIKLDKALFYDIETHRVVNWKDQTPALQRAFVNHYYDSDSYDSPEEHYSEIAGLYAEFSHVIMVVFGYESPEGELKTTAIYGKDEREVLESCSKIFDYFMREGFYLAGHNIKACDTAYLVKRYIINKMRVPDFINEYGQKPWQSTQLDTMDLWKFGDYKRVSLETICAALNIPCKTSEIGGSNLYEYDIDDMPWETLKEYCTEDVRSNYLMTKEILKYYSTDE